MVFIPQGQVGCGVSNWGRGYQNQLEFINKRNGPQENSLDF